MTRKVFLPSYSCLNSMLLWHHGVSLRANPWAKQTDKGLESSEKKTWPESKTPASTLTKKPWDTGGPWGPRQLGAHTCFYQQLARSPATKAKKRTSSQWHRVKKKNQTVELPGRTSSPSFHFPKWWSTDERGQKKKNGRYRKTPSPWNYLWEEGSTLGQKSCTLTWKKRIHLKVSTTPPHQIWFNAGSR